MSPLEVVMRIAKLLRSYFRGQEYRAYQAKANIATTLSNRTYAKLIRITYEIKSTDCGLK